jgi:Glycosyl transferase 4-like
MRILHVFDQLLPLRLLGILAAQRGFGGETIHVTAPHHNEFRAPVETVDGWTFHRTPKPHGKMEGAPIARELMEMRAVAVRLDEVIRAEKPDIVHAHSPVLVGWPTLQAARNSLHH